MCISCAGKVTLHSSPRPARLLLWTARAGLLKRSVLLDSAGEFTSQKISPGALSWVSTRGTCALWVTDLPSRLREGSVFTPRIEGAPGAQLDSAPSPALEAGSVTGASAKGSGTWGQVSAARTLVCVCSEPDLCAPTSVFSLGSENESVFV